MNKITDYFRLATKTKKVTFLIIITVLILMCAIGIPTLARFKNRATIKNVYVWDGTIASSYKSGDGTAVSPYIISNGSELAFMAQELLNTNYENTYFALTSDIILNNGIFNYDETDGPQITISGIKYYLEEYTNKYYQTTLREGTEAGSLNLFGSLSNFKGHLDGRSFSIYGLYMTDNEKEELGLFNNLQGEVQNLYVENALIYGGDVNGGLSSTTNGALIKNVLASGYLVSNQTNSIMTKQIPLSVNNINLQTTEQNLQVDINKNIPVLGSSNISTSLEGTYTINGANPEEVTIKINGTEVSGGIINLNLGTTILDQITITTITTSLNAPVLTISNLIYDVDYEYSASGGLVGYSQNTTIANSVNKIKVYGNSVSGGLVGATTSNLSINNSYNAKEIDGTNYSGGLVGVIENSSNDVSITNSYNSSNITGTVSGGLIGEINNNIGEVNIENSFNAYETNYAIDTILASYVNVTNSYYLETKDDIRSGNTTGSFTDALITELQDKTFVTTNLLYNEFESFSDLAINPGNVWVYTLNELPIIYIDDEVNTSAVLTSGNYTWNNYSAELNAFVLYSTIKFSINDVDIEKPTQSKYYFVSDSSTPLTKVELANYSSWNTYTSEVNLTSEGPHIIYVKIVDYSNNTIYLNSDVININLSASSISIGFENYNWDYFKSNVSNVYINSPKSISLGIEEDANVSNIKYYVSNTSLSTDDLNAMNINEWTPYNNDILIDQLGEFIIYVMAFDNNNKLYINSDRIIFGGYEEKNFIMGSDTDSYLGELNNITSRSKISFNISFENLNAEALSSYNHNIASNILLPKNTLITIYDKITNKIYEYKINTDDDIYNFNDSCEENDIYCTKTAIYPFNLFKEVGTLDEDEYIETSYYNNGVINENYTVFVDFTNALITELKENIKIYALLKDNSGNVIRPTIDSTIIPFNIYPTTTSKADLNLESDYNLNAIELNSDSSTNINIGSYLRYKYINELKIIDTYYEERTMGISIQVTNSDGQIVSRDQLKGLIFKMNDKAYAFGEDNKVRISLGNKMLDTNKILNILTYANSNTLLNGNYNILISNYAALDGRHYSEVGESQITIPLSVTNYIKDLNHKFDVLVSGDDRIIERDMENPSILFNIIQNTNMDNVSIKVSLYKKDSLTAYNQNYTLVDLQTYTTTTLNSYVDKIYSVTNNPLEYNGTFNTYNPLNLNLIMNSFENTGYKFVFDLYSSNIKVGTINKYFIVK